MSRPVSPNSPIRGTSVSPSRRNTTTSPSRRNDTSPSRKPNDQNRPTSPPVNTSPSRRPKITKKFSESDFENKRESIDPELRKKQLQAKIRGLKLEPKDWTRQELFEKMSQNFNIVYEGDKDREGSVVSSPSRSNVVSEIHILPGIKLTNDEITIFNEFCRRNTEIKVINLTNAGITDDYMKLILQGLKLIKTIKFLNLNINYLTIVGLEDIMKAFGGSLQVQQVRKKLEKISLQGNVQLTYDDGFRFIQALLTLEQINTLPVAQMKADGLHIKSWDLSNQDIRLFELGMICFLMKNYLYGIEEIILANNQINTKGFHYLLDTVSHSLKSCNTIDISGNNITNNGYDMSGMLKLLYLLQSSKQFHFIVLNNVPGLSPEIIEKVDRSCAVNRSVYRINNNYYFFNTFLKNKIEERGAEREAKFQQRLSELEKWKPNRDTIDEYFIKRNRLPVCDIKFLFYDSDEDKKNEDDDDEDDNWSDIEEDELDESSVESEKGGFFNAFGLRRKNNPKKKKKTKKKSKQPDKKHHHHQHKLDIDSGKSTKAGKLKKSTLDNPGGKSTKNGTTAGVKFAANTQILNDDEVSEPDHESTSIMSKISYDGPSEPNTSDKIVNGFQLRWIIPKYDENFNMIY